MYVLNHYDAHMKLIQYSVNYISTKKKEPHGSHCVINDTLNDDSKLPLHCIQKILFK